MRKSSIIMLLIIIALLPVNILWMWQIIVTNIFLSEANEKVQIFREFYKISPLRKGFFLAEDKEDPDCFTIGNRDILVDCHKSEKYFSISVTKVTEIDSPMTFSYKGGSLVLSYGGYCWNDWNGDGFFDLRRTSALTEKAIPLNGVWVKCKWDNSIKTATLTDGRVFHFDGQKWVQQPCNAPHFSRAALQ